MRIAIIIFVILIVVAVFGLLAKEYVLAPTTENSEPTACTMEGKVCPDGTVVGRTGPNCEFAACPTPDDDTDASTDEAFTHFVSETEAAVISEMGQPIEGFEPFMFIQVYPNVIEADFANAETLGDTNPSGVMTSADAALTREGMRTFMVNVSERAEIDVTTRADVDRLLTFMSEGEAAATKDDLIKLTSPVPNATITSPLTITGEARGQWFFEATFSVVLTDWDGRIIAEHYATAQDEWMTEEYVPFSAELEFESPYSAGDPDFMKRGTLILQKANPSGLPEHDNALEFTVWFAE